MEPLANEKISQQLALWPEETLFTDELKQYFDYYRFALTEADDIQVQVSYINVARHRIAVYHLTPKKPIQHVLIMHGYLDHSGIHADLVNDLLSKNCQVSLYDMPGHGLSTGPNADIDDFRCYVEVLGAVLTAFSEKKQLPDAVLAHSTGAAALILALLSGELPRLAAMNIILVAPLVRIANWYRIKLTYHLIRHWLSEVKLGKIDNSADRKFTDFLLADPLRHCVMPIQWLEAAFEYEKSLSQYPPCEKSITVIQGSDDTTVAWSYNLRFLHHKFPQARVYCIEDAKHHVLYEREALRQRAREILYERLGLSKD
ncbi:alpha/beta hydrolase [Piscirickettsia litoralis]|uniref:Alpha/beta hydrolase n=1 Tax=Piscirickettsia litoralis TaxID=1891921 RepID=A0ABX3A4L9_9GAMM|nr:alpha/beta hydrolase [Piscirickettsia litoralis]ODN43192.1 alpha/beta hydrolase [Piscirickettsia litoralis]